MSGQRLRGEWVLRRPPPALLPAADSGSARLRLPFALAGDVTVWEPIHRHLEIGPRDFVLAPGVRVTGLAPGVHVTLAGYVKRLADSTSRSIVTRLIVG
jgi:hypothetical protein